MKGKKQISSLGLSLILLMFLMVSFAAAKSFDPVFNYVEQFQKGEDIELRVHVGKDSFTFLRSEETKINQATFQSLLTEDAVPQQLKISPNGEFMIKYEAGDLLNLEQTLIENIPKQWRKIEFVKIASYPLDQWLVFLKRAFSRGLMEYETIEYEEEFFASLTFKQTDPRVLSFGRQQISFSDEFFEHMKFSRDFKPRKTNTKKVVVLVHEPHWLLAGQYQLVPGLRAFLIANSNYKFRFLVEGYWENEIKNILTKPTLDQFFKDFSTAAQVYSLLGKFLIDGPLAYRLLYEPDLPALAIDDPKLIKETPREPKFRDLFEQQDVFIKIIGKLQKLRKDKANEAMMTLAVLGFLVKADTQELTGQATVDHVSQISELYNELRKQLVSLDSQNFKEECSFLEYQAACYRTQKEVLGHALKRDVAMTKNILSHFDSDYSQRIPIVFIGNFHTPAIIDNLPNDVAYVVIEPRLSILSLAPPERDRDNFNDALKLDTRPSYLTKFRSILKLQVAPLKRELPYYNSFLKRESLRIQSQRNAFASSSPLPSSLTSKIYSTLISNGVFSSAQISFAGGGENVPPTFRGAFASFSFGPKGISPMLLFYDRKKDNWTRPDRLNYLRKIQPILPYEKIKKSVRKVSFYQDKDSNRMFFFIFDPKTQTFYLFDGSETMDIQKLLIPPEVQGEENAPIHLKLSLRERIHYESQKTHG
ncbi:MAG: hypothetical protein ACFFCW_20845 [Candidatus Hodarchaeota archaeon]